MECGVIVKRVPVVLLCGGVWISNRCQSSVYLWSFSDVECGVIVKRLPVVLLSGGVWISNRCQSSECLWSFSVVECVVIGVSQAGVWSFSAVECAVIVKRVPVVLLSGGVFSNQYQPGGCLWSSAEECAVLSISQAGAFDASQRRSVE